MKQETATIINISIKETEHRAKAKGGK